MSTVPFWKLEHTLIAAALLSSVLTALPAKASADFSKAHKKIERAIESAAANAPIDAMWLRHDTLLIAVNKGKTNAKDYAKGVCAFLAENGFAAQQTKLVIADQVLLRKQNKIQQLAERRCD